MEKIYLLADTAGSKVTAPKSGLAFAEAFFNTALVDSYDITSGTNESLCLQQKEKGAGQLMLY